ncbi:MAG: hypothetical protein J6I60_06545 [Bacteroidaceae bacterium]|nr:hypothetical protein [Bacteroidaceae bacterium]
MRHHLSSLLLVSFLLLAATAHAALTPRQLLDKAAAVVGRKGGATAQFTITADKHTMSGTIAIKGSKFYAKTQQTTTWYDGKTQWTYVTDTDEVNISQPTKAQQTQLNPYTFLSLYKKGYGLSARTVKGMHEVRLVALGTKQPIREAFITLNPNTYQPTMVRMKQQGKWLTITIRNFRAVNQSDATFVFPAKKYPTAEVIDLR